MLLATIFKMEAVEFSDFTERFEKKKLVRFDLISLEARGIWLFNSVF